MNEQLQISFWNMVAKVGLETAISIMKATSRAATIDDAIKALDSSLQVTLADAKLGRV